MKGRHIEPYKDPHRWTVFTILSSVYLFVYFHRVSTSVIAGDLLEAFETNASALGMMSSMYFYVYALEQPLVGYLSDKIGPKRVVGVWTLIAAMGAFIFGAAPSIFWASVGRCLIGFGVGGVYVPALKSFTQWFSKKDFPALTGLFMAAGNLGAIIATTPLVWSAKALGWRTSFFIISAVTLALALATFLLMRDHPLRKAQKAETQNGNKGISIERVKDFSLVNIFSSFSFWCFGSILFLTVGAFITLQGLWATPFLISAYGLKLTTASNLNMLIPLGFIAAAPLWGWLAKHFHHRVELLTILLFILTALWIVLISLGPLLGIGGIIALMLAFGITGGGVMTTLWSSIRETTPERIIGVTTGMLNPFPIFGIAVFQVWTGALLDNVGKTSGIYPIEAFKSAFLRCLAATAFSAVIAVIARHFLLKARQ